MYGWGFGEPRVPQTSCCGQSSVFWFISCFYDKHRDQRQLRGRNGSIQLPCSESPGRYAKQEAGTETTEDNRSPASSLASSCGCLRIPDLPAWGQCCSPGLWLDADWMTENFIIPVCAQTVSPDSTDKNASLEISPDCDANKRQMGTDLKTSREVNDDNVFLPPRKKL